MDQTVCSYPYDSYCLFEGTVKVIKDLEDNREGGLYSKLVKIDIE
jgi:hypothetical protein